MGVPCYFYGANGFGGYIFEAWRLKYAWAVVVTTGGGIWKKSYGWESGEKAASRWIVKESEVRSSDRRWRRSERGFWKRSFPFKATVLVIGTPERTF